MQNVSGLPSLFTSVFVCCFVDAKSTTDEHGSQPGFGKDDDGIDEHF